MKCLECENIVDGSKINNPVNVNVETYMMCDDCYSNITKSRGFMRMIQRRLEMNKRYFMQDDYERRMDTYAFLELGWDYFKSISVANQKGFFLVNDRYYYAPTTKRYKDRSKNKYVKLSSHVDFINIISKESELDKTITSKEKAKTKKQTYNPQEQKPTINDITKYVKSKYKKEYWSGWGFEIESIHDYYDSKDWKTKAGNNITNWRQSVCRWLNKAIDEGKVFEKTERDIERKIQELVERNKELSSKVVELERKKENKNLDQWVKDAKIQLDILNKERNDLIKENNNLKSELKKTDSNEFINEVLSSRKSADVNTDLIINSINKVKQNVRPSVSILWGLITF